MRVRCERCARLRDQLSDHRRRWHVHVHARERARARSLASLREANRAALAFAPPSVGLVTCECFSAKHLCGVAGFKCGSLVSVSIVSSRLATESSSSPSTSRRVTRSSVHNRPAQRAHAHRHTHTHPPTHFRTGKTHTEQLCAKTPAISWQFTLQCRARRLTQFVRPGPLPFRSFDRVGIAQRNLCTLTPAARKAPPVLGGQQRQQRPRRQRR